MYHLPRSSLQRKWGHSRQRSSLSSHVVQMRQNSPSHKNTQNDTSVLKTKPATFLDLSISSSGSSISLSTNNNVFKLPQIISCQWFIESLLAMWTCTGQLMGRRVAGSFGLSSCDATRQYCSYADNFFPVADCGRIGLCYFGFAENTLAYNNFVSLNLSMYWKILLQWKGNQSWKLARRW